MVTIERKLMKMTNIKCNCNNTNLNKSVDRHNGHIRLRFGIVHQIQIDQFLQFQVVRLHAVDDIREKGGDIFADGHAGNDLRM